MPGVKSQASAPPFGPPLWFAPPPPPWLWPKALVSRSYRYATYRLSASLIAMISAATVPPPALAGRFAPKRTFTASSHSPGEITPSTLAVPHAACTGASFSERSCSRAGGGADAGGRFVGGGKSPGETEELPLQAAASSTAAHA